ncbi:DUF1275 family protein [Colwellia sp. MEBiC06753]
MMIGGVFRGEALDKRKAQLFTLIICSFILGGTFGAWLFLQVQFYALIIPATICLSSAILYRLYLKRFQ